MKKDVPTSVDEGPPDDPSTVARELLQIIDSELMVQDAVPKLVRALGQKLGWDVATLWVIDARVNRLRCSGFWAEFPQDHKKFERATRESTFPEGNGLPGRAWRSGVPIWTVEVGDDPRFQDDVDLHGAFVFPVVAEERFVGVVELLSREMREVDVGLQRRMVLIGAEIGRMLDRRLEAEAAGAERARLELALAASGMGVWEWDLQSNKVRWSQTLERMHSFEPGMMLEGTVEDFVSTVHPDDRDWVLGIFVRSLEHPHEEPVHAEYRSLRPDGDIRWLELWGRSLLDGAGNVIAMTGVVLDVSDRVEREQASRVDRAQLELAAKVRGFGRWEWSTCTNTGRWSQDMIDIVGGDIDGSRLTVDDVVAILHPEDRGIMADIQEATEAKRDHHAVYRVVRPDGEIRRLESWGRPLYDLAGELVGMAGIAVDATERGGVEIER